MANTSYHFKTDFQQLHEKLQNRPKASLKTISKNQRQVLQQLHEKIAKQAKIRL